MSGSGGSKKKIIKSDRKFITRQLKWVTDICEKNNFSVMPGFD